MEDPGSPCPDVEMEDPESASLQAAMDAPFTASLGPMGPLLRQLHSQPKGVGGDKIQLLKDDLVGLCISLKDVSEADGASFMAKWWMKEVRELCYDTQDYLDEAFVKYSGAGARRSTRLRVGGKLEWRPQIGKKGQGRWGTSRLQQISTKRRNLKRQPRKAAISFRELMARVEVLGDVSERFELGVEAIKPDHAQAGVSRLTPHRSLRLHSDAGGLSLVGAEEPVNKLVDLLAFDDDSHKQLKVVSIFGFAGVGKTTAATTLYRNFKGKFQCRAFVRVSRTPDMMGILTSILSQIKAPQVRGFPDVQDLIDNIREHLQGKRYFIIIDDLWTTSVWNIINRAFPDGDCGSRIVTTTETEDISLACCSYDFTYIFQMCPLNDDQSRKLFFSRVFGSENGCPPDFREVSYGIIRKCGGSPLATVIVASMLASELNLVMEQWKTIQDSLSSIVSTNPTSEGTKEVLNLIYNYLPPHLKTCLLHLGVYPEASTIGKDDLVKQWVAEGFLGTMEESQNTEKIAGAYFDELVSRGMVQAANTNYSGEVLFCTVHQIVLDFIRDKSMEENFAITVDYFQSTLALPDKVRRLSVQFGGAKSAKIPEGIIISHVRSLLFFGFIKCVPLILGYGFLRVLILHIRADEDKIIDLSRISELCRLKYLKIKCNITIKLPAKIGRIQDLETLEVDARLFAVPSDIVHLEKLLHLRLPSESYLPHEVGHMTRLRTLGYFDIGRNSEDNVMDLCKLTNLQDLQLICSTVQVAQNLEKNLHLLGSILEKLSILQSVTLVPTADSNAFTKKKKDSNANILKDHAGTCTSIFCDSLSSVSLAPSHLERIELLPRICIFPILPKWFEQLGKLRTLKIAVRELRREDIHILKALPALSALSLYVQTAPAETIVFDKTGFLVLSYLKFRCTTPSLKFESDAMPNLLKLKISFNVASRVEHVTAAISIEHLSGLKEISTKIRGAGAISIEQLSGVKQISTEMRSEGADPEWAWRATIINHKNNPTMNVQLVGCFLNGNPSMETQDKDEVEDEEEEPKPNDMRTLTQPFSSSHLLTPDILLNDFLIPENAPFQSETDGVPRSENQNSNPNFNSHSPSFQQYTNNSHEIAPGFSKEKKSIEMLTEASAAEAEAVSAVASSEDNLSEGIGSESPLSETSPMTDDLDDGGPMQPDMKLHSRAFVVAKEAVGDLGCLVRQLSLDQFENESRRMHPANKDQSYSSKKALSRQRSPQGLHKKIISLLLRPRNWNAPADRAFFLDSYEVAELCYAAEQIFMQEPTVLQLKEPVKVFGDLHGQFGDLMRLFDEYGYPSIAGDITYIDYLFLGDYVDRGQHSLETITLLLALKIEYPEHVHLIRGNHEAADINALFGFRLECIERMGESDGIWAWSRFNQLFNHLPLAAMIEKKIICMHGGIGRSINSVEQIEKIERPITMDERSIILMDLLWSNPTENNSVEGLRPNARGPSLVTFGPDRVTEFCKRNKLRLIIRAHESVMDGFERFAHGQLITLFSATNYCGTAKNAGAILVVGRGLVIVPKLIHPLPPPINSPESCPATDATWMQELNIQRPPTPTRGRPQSAGELTYDA